MAYRAVRLPLVERDKYASEVTAYIMNKVVSLLDALLPLRTDYSRDLASLKTTFAGRALKVVQNALRLQELTQDICVSFDYSTFLPFCNVPFDPSTMEVDEEVEQDHTDILGVAASTVSPGVVLMPTTLGLQAHRKGISGMEKSVLRKAKVVVAFESSHR